jgi:predicted RecB family nuclease
MTRTQTLALAYAKTLVAYYAAKRSEGIDKDTNVRKAYNALCDAQNAMAEAAEAEAAAAVEDDEYGTKAMQDWLAQQAYEKAY